MSRPPTIRNNVISLFLFIFFGTAAFAQTCTISSQINVACFGDSTGQAVVVASGGTGPYTYSWNTTPVQTTDTAFNLPAGTYTVTVTDASLNTCASTVTITQPASALTDTSTSTNLTCFNSANGTALATGYGGTPPYTYLWMPNSATTSSIAGLIAGTYTSTITDTNGCTATDVVTITQPTNISISIGGQNVACNGNCTGILSAFVSGGTPPYSYLWSPGNETTSLINNLCVGIYTVVVTDAAGCTNSFISPISQPPVLVTATDSIPASCGICPDGSAVTTPSGGVPPYTYSWAPGGQTDSTATGLLPGIYTVTITDFNNCTTTDTIEVTFSVGMVSLQNNIIEISPNPVHRMLKIKIKENAEFSLTNSLGESVMKNYCLVGEAEIDFSTLPEGIYFLSILNENGISVTKIVKE